MWPPTPPKEKTNKSPRTPRARVPPRRAPHPPEKRRGRAKRPRGAKTRAPPKRPAITNLLDVYSAMSGKPVAEIEAGYEGKGYGDLKNDLAEVVVEGLAPVRDRARELLDDPAELDDLLESGARHAHHTARPVLESAWAKLGLD